MPQMGQGIFEGTQLVRPEGTNRQKTPRLLARPAPLSSASALTFMAPPLWHSPTPSKMERCPAATRSLCPLSPPGCHTCRAL